MTRTLIALLLGASLAAAQQPSSMAEKLKQQMEEITRLMRESERWLLEMTRVDRVAATQTEIVEKLKKLLPDEPGLTAQQQAERDRQRQQLRQEQEATVRKLQQMLQGQRSSAEMTVKKLQELLRNLPRQRSKQSSQGGRDRDQKRSKADREKRLDDQRKERTQEQPRSPRKKKDRSQDPQRSSRAKPKSEAEAARVNRFEAWFARLPPEQQERINRNDFGGIPSRYRRLVEEYTAQRAKREAEAEAEPEGEGD